MSQPITISFKVGATTVHPAGGDFVTDSIPICENYKWAFEAIPVGLDGSPTYTIEVSNDNATWKNYDALAVDVAIIDGLDDTHLPWQFMRVVYTAVDNTTGTVELRITLKRG